MRRFSQHNNLYVPKLESDACGIGLIANFSDKPNENLLNNALIMLENMSHRGATGSDSATGDGAGILIQIPYDFYAERAKTRKRRLPHKLGYGTGLIFIDKSKIDLTFRLLKKEIKDSWFELLDFYPLDVNSEILGETSGLSEPIVYQVFVKPLTHLDPKILEIELYKLRRKISKTWQRNDLKREQAYICSLSCRTIVYKGYLTNSQLRNYYNDLKSGNMVTDLAIVHSRFSTNTRPQWFLAQPFRFIAHNGEINTIEGNLNSWNARENEISNFDFNMSENFFPVTDDSLSDSCNLDKVIEFLTFNGRTLPEALMMLIPEAYQNDKHIQKTKADFYEYNEYIIEPWEGPASLVFTDGTVVGACLDRNGLRPSRYCITSDDTLVLASESGCIEIPNEEILVKGRVEPGKMLVVDMQERRIISDEELKNKVCNNLKFEKGLNKSRINIDSIVKTKKLPASKHDLLTRQLSAGYNKEDVELILKSMSLNGKETIGSMGRDIPLAVMSHFVQPVANYFKQQFAQVTNPPIDPIREEFFMSLKCGLGKFVNIFGEPKANHKIIRLDSPILSSNEIGKIYSLDYAKVVSLTYTFDRNKSHLKQAINNLCEFVEVEIKRGISLIILSDHELSKTRIAIPSLLAIGALNNFLIERGLRKSVSLIVTSGDIIETHHVATLLSFGADAVHPYLAIETTKKIAKPQSESETEKKYLKALEKGLLKIMSKLGIATLISYKAAQTFEALGIAKEVIDFCFPGTVSRIGGMNFEMLEKEALRKHEMAFGFKLNGLEDVGDYSWRSDGEYHLFNPLSIHLLRNSCRLKAFDLFENFCSEIDKREKQFCTLRSLFAFKNNERESISINEVESEESILKRFATGAMSFGSLSHEAHTTLAMAMNRIGGKSNSGEGGEDPSRYQVDENGDSMSSAIKQVASGRFGVTIDYLVNANELQIKMAQGAKPGEGGHLPGYKVNEWIGRVRNAKPGTELISPPPHHDIYSIEDLAQLIFDLKNVNPEARISVKLVSKAGVGIISSGVVKAKAEHILISGYDGGTGASPLSSIRHAGIPWELGLSEAHQVLVKNRLRERVVLQCDGQIRTPRDIIIATLLGAEEWGISTAALVVQGCILLRKCHLNTCSVGIATQDSKLRKNFDGKVNDVVQYFKFLARGVRELMAELGFRNINEMVGRVDMLKQRAENLHWKSQSLNLSSILNPSLDCFGNKYNCLSQDFKLKNVLDKKLIEKIMNIDIQYKNLNSIVKISNTDRSVGSMLSNYIVRKWGSSKLEKGKIDFRMRGSAGQSFGAFTTQGIAFTLEGEANDYFGKGLSGARLTVVPDRYFSGNPQQNLIVGNVALYGATSGEVYINGNAGERFAVRNSGAEIVVESIGSNGCEYMTGGLVIVLGDIGRNFGAGMSGGSCFVYSPNVLIYDLINKSSVELSKPNESEIKKLNKKVRDFYFYSNSKKALAIINNWETKKSGFMKIAPIKEMRTSNLVSNYLNQKERI